MTPVEILVYALVIGVALVIVAILGGLAYVIWQTAVQSAHNKEVKK